MTDKEKTIKRNQDISNLCTLELINLLMAIITTYDNRNLLILTILLGCTSGCLYFIFQIKRMRTAILHLKLFGSTALFIIAMVNLIF